MFLVKCLLYEYEYQIYIQLDSDGDGQLSFEEFKVLFDNAEKRRKNSETELPLHNSMPKVIIFCKDIIVVNMDNKITKFYILQEVTRPSCLLSDSETPSPRRKGCSFRDKKVHHQFSRLSLRDIKPRIIITSSSPDMMAEGFKGEEKNKTRKVSEC